jgi:hypothetical protein
MQFSAGSVISRAFGVTTKNFATFLVIGVVVMVPILVLNHLLVPDAPDFGDLRDLDRVEPSTASPVRQLASTLLNMVGQSVLAGALAFGVFQSLSGQRPSVGECLSRGFERLLPIVGVSIVYGLAVGVGMLLLIVPGVMIACMWYVGVPVTTVEKLGVGASLTRSGVLTQGHRMSIFAMFLLVLLLGLAVGMLLVGAFAAMGALVSTILTGVLSVFIAIYSGTLSAVTYHDLRVVKEGATTEDLLEVFR